MKLKTGRRKEIIKERVEIMKMGRDNGKNSISKTGSLKKMNKLGKPLARLQKSKHQTH
jgi:hypothetical protein